MKLRRVLAILTLLAFAIIPVMAQTAAAPAAAPAVVYPVTTMNGYLYSIISSDFGLLGSYSVWPGQTAYALTPTSSGTASVVSDGLWAEADLILNQKVTKDLTAQLRYYYATTTTNLNTVNTYPIPGILIAKGELNISTLFGLPVDMVDVWFNSGFYGLYDNAYSYVSMRGWEDVSIAGTSANSYEWYVMPFLGFMNNIFFLKFGWTPQTYYTELSNTYDVDNDWIVGFYGTPNLGFGTLKFELWYDAYNTNGAGSADKAATTYSIAQPTTTGQTAGTIYSSTTNAYSGLKSVADRLDWTKGWLQANARLEIPLDKVNTVWVGAGAWYDLATYTNTSFAIVANLKWNVTGKFLMADLLDSAVALWGTNLDPITGFDATIYVLNMWGIVPNLDFCVDVKLSFATDNTYPMDRFTAAGGVSKNGMIANKTLEQTFQGLDVALRMRSGGAMLFVGFAITGSYTDPATNKVYYVGTNNAGAWIYNAAGQNIGSAPAFYVPGGLYTRLYIPL